MVLAVLSISWQTQVPAASCSWLRSVIQQRAGHAGGGAANGAPHQDITGGPLVLRELHAEGVRYHVPKLSANAGHRVEGDAVAAALMHTMCMFFAG